MKIAIVYESPSIHTHTYTHSHLLNDKLSSSTKT